MIEKMLGEEVVIVVTDPDWAEKFADFATAIAGGATTTVSQGRGQYNTLKSSVIKEDVWIISSFVESAVQFNEVVRSLLKTYLQDTKEESVLLSTNGKAKLYYLEQGE